MTGKNSTDEQDETAASGASAKPAGRQARLEEALRANLLKRKAKTRVSRQRGNPEEGRQT